MYLLKYIYVLIFYKYLYIFIFLLFLILDRYLSLYLSSYYINIFLIVNLYKIKNNLSLTDMMRNYVVLTKLHSTLIYKNTNKFELK